MRGWLDASSSEEVPQAVCAELGFVATGGGLIGDGHNTGVDDDEDPR